LNFILALFLRHDGYLGCLGALIKDWYQAPHTLPSFEENFARPSPFLKSFGNLGSLDSREEVIFMNLFLKGKKEKKMKQKKKNFFFFFLIRLWYDSL